MPTHEETEQFWRDWAHLTTHEKAAFKEAVRKFVEDLENQSPGQFRGGLRVKPMQGAPGVHEMSWEPHDGRATFQYGEQLSEGDPHIIWRRIGGHGIFGDP